MKIYLLEDNSIQMGRLEEAVAHELKSFGKDLSCVQSFDKPDQLLSAITSNTSDQIFFLDIEIKGEDKKGLDIAKIIRQNNPYAIIAFVTTHIEFMPQAFGVTAYKYINKTLDEASFRKEIGKPLLKSSLLTQLPRMSFFSTKQSLN
ncbi:response regulator [Streptococcus thermophilus]|nr:response regulator [Streptococcus thermophilus]